MNNKYIILLGLCLTATNLSSCIFFATRVGCEIIEEIDEIQHENREGHHSDRNKEHNLLPDGHRIKAIMQD